MSQQIRDYLGTLHTVEDVRPTEHGFDLLIGRPVGEGRGGRRVIPTRPLVDLLLAHAHQPANPTLPISKQAIGRVRKMLGINRYTSIAEWWSRQTTAANPQAVEAAALGRSASAVSLQERRRGIRRLRPAGWWRTPEARALILAGTTAQAAAAVGQSVGSIRRLRSMLARSTHP